jgi:hypothetical protein
MFCNINTDLVCFAEGQNFSPCMFWSLRPDFLDPSKRCQTTRSLDPVAFGENCLSLLLFVFPPNNQWILRMESYTCCLSRHTYTHKVHKGAFNVLQNSLAYQIQPEKVKALCACVCWAHTQLFFCLLLKNIVCNRQHIQPEKAANSEESI